MDIEKLNCRCGCGLKPKAEAVDELQVLEKDSGVDFDKISGARCIPHNRKIGGDEGSTHTLCIAFDIECRDAEERNAIIKSIYYRQFIRLKNGEENYIKWITIEVCDCHIHITFNINNRFDQKVKWGKSK